MKSGIYLSYTIPMSKRGLTEEQIPVLATVHHGGPWGTVPELFFEEETYSASTAVACLPSTTHVSRDIDNERTMVLA